MLNKFFKNKTLSLTSPEVDLSLDYDSLGGGSYAMSLDVLPKQFEGDIFSLIALLGGAQVAEDIESFLGEGLSDVMSFLHFKKGQVCLGDVVVFNYESIRLIFEKGSGLTNEAIPVPKKNVCIEVKGGLVFDLDLSQLFGGRADSSANNDTSSATLLNFAGCLRFNVGNLGFAPVSFEPDQHGSSMPSQISIPLPGVQDNLLITPDVKLLSLVPSTNTDSSNESSASMSIECSGNMLLSGGPKGIQNADNTPHVLPLTLIIKNGLMKLQSSLFIPALDLNLQQLLGVDVNLGSVGLDVGNLAFTLPMNKGADVDGGGNKAKCSAELHWRLPDALNSLIPGIDPFNVYRPANAQATKFKMRLNLDEAGLHSELLSSPFKDFEQGDVFVKTELRQNRLWWLIKMADYGHVEIKSPVFHSEASTGAMEGSGAFKIIEPVCLPLTDIKSFLDKCGLSFLSALLPDDIELPHNKKGEKRQRDLNDFGLLPSLMNNVLSKIGIDFDGLMQYLPDRLKHFLTIDMPDEFAFNVCVASNGSCTGAIALPEGQSLKLLLSAGPALYGIELRQLSLGQLNGGKMGLLEVDGSIDMFMLPEIVASMAATVAGVPMLPPSKALIMQLQMNKLLAFVHFQSTAIVPVFYDRLELNRIGFEGVELRSQWKLPKPVPSAIELAPVVGDIINFVLDKEALFDANSSPFTPPLTFTIGENYLKLPEYFGGPVLGQKSEIASMELWPLIAHGLNFIKTGRIDEFLQAFPLDYRVGSQSVNFFGLASIDVDWLISSPKEFITKAYQKLKLNSGDSGSVLSLLPDSKLAGTDSETNRLVALMRGEADIAGVVKLASTFVFSGGLTGVTTGFQFSGELANLVGVDLQGKVALELDPAEFEVMGSSQLSLLGATVLQGKVGVKNDLLYLSGALSLFPESNILSLTADVEGQFSQSGICIKGDTDFRVGGVSVIQGEVLLTERLLKVAGNCLGVTTELAIGEQRGQIQINGALKLHESLSIQTQDIVVQGIKLSDPIRIETSIEIDLGITASLDSFRLQVGAAFMALDEGFNIDITLSVMPSSVDDLLKTLLSKATQMVQDFVTGLLNRPEKLLEAICKAVLASTKTNISAISIDSDGTDVGLLSLQNRLFNITALAAYNGGNGLDNLFAYAQSNQASIRAPSFKVESIAVAMACNRGVRMPDVDQVKSFPLVERLSNRDNIGASASRGDIQKARHAIGELISKLPSKQGTHTIAAGIKANSFKLIDSTNVFMTEMGSDLAAYLVGTSSMKLPPKPLTTVVNMEINYRAAIDLKLGSVQVDGRLTSNSYVLSKSAKLSGGFAYHSWLAGPNSGDFVMTMGGYAPGFRRPSHYPAVPRLKLNWRISSNLNAKGSMYMALTPTNIMAGGNLEAIYKTGPLKASFDAAIQFMMYWQPFYYKASIDIDISASVTLKVKINLAFTSFTIRKTFRSSLGAELDVWGPNFAGKAKVKWSIFSFKIGFGSSSKPAPTPISWNKFKQDYLSNGRNLVPEIVVAKGAMGIMNDGGKEWQVVDPDVVELTVSSKFPLKRLLIRPQASDQQDKAWISQGRDFHLAATNSSGPESADQWYVDMQYNGPDGMYFQGESINQVYPKAVWGSEFKPRPSNNPTLSLLSGARLVPHPGKPPGFTDAVDADEFKYQDGIEEDPYWEWGKPLAAELDSNQASNIKRIIGTIESSQAVTRRKALADFIGYDESLSVTCIAKNPEANFIGIPRSATI